ncbi:putative bifunctional diguanylate cyclase/phosphodiesterase [Vreelandella jeotgali]|uniref:putative bifunctional diguanylate cyclase/phosphodiesterase n=1 Tax=Vreelandella jeotgali TaxID=553386 RepID=UPI000345C793|nr:GGDEF domain-containing phosphodiesterase [Halomonas jeotgali]
MKRAGRLLDTRSLTARFTFFVVTLTVVSGLTLGGLLGYGSMRDDVNEQYANANQRLDFIQEPARFALYQLDTETVDVLLQGFQQGPAYQRIDLINDQGQNVGHVRHQPTPPALLTPLIKRLFFSNLPALREQRLYYTSPFNPEKSVFVGHLEAEFDLNRMINTATATLFDTFWATCIQALVLGILVAVVFYAAVGRPLQAITRTISRHAREGNPFATLDLAVSGFELKQLVRHYNKHAHRGERYFNELTDANRVLDEQARRDPLTLDYNRRELIKRLKALLGGTEPKPPLALVIWDIDGFAQTNDRYGQDIGDAALREVSAHLRRHFSDAAPLYRLQADTFAMHIDLEHTRDGQAADDAPLQQPLAETLSVETTLEADKSSSTIELTLSAGIALSPDHATTPESLLRAAQLGLANAKHGGKQCLRSYSPDADDRQKRKVAALVLLKERLADGNFTLAYQPKVCLRDGSLKGCEALFRLDTQASAAPWELLQEAEATGLIVPLGFEIIRRALMEFAPLLPRLGDDFRLGINISPQQLVEPDFHHQLQQLLQHYRFPPEHLDLEITEATPLINNHAFNDNHRRLRDIGVSFSLDDFGTGYASIEYLLFIGFDFLKIDRQFVKHLPDDANSLRVCRAVLLLARELGCHTVIEGIETPEQEALMQQHQATLGQGFLYARPLGLTDFIDYLAASEGPTA